MSTYSRCCHLQLEHRLAEKRSGHCWCGACVSPAQVGHTVSHGVQHLRVVIIERNNVVGGERCVKHNNSLDFSDESEVSGQSRTHKENSRSFSSNLDGIMVGVSIS